MFPNNFKVIMLMTITRYRYVAGFLSVKESFAPAHKLLGQILHGLKQTDKAITAYKRSLELDDKQKDVILKSMYMCVSCLKSSRSIGSILNTS